MSHTLIQKDLMARQQALDLRSLIVEAPAGAGKTELLTQRFLKLLSVVNNPEEIMAVTFTNKAAAEMQDRILKSLKLATHSAAAISALPPHKHLTVELAKKALERAQEQGWQLLEIPSRLRVLTLDSLCARLVYQVPILSQVGAHPKITDRAGHLYQEAISRTLALLDSPSKYADVVKSACLQLRNDSRRLTELLSTMLQRREQWLAYIFHAMPSQTMRQTLNQVQQRMLDNALQALTPAIQQNIMPSVQFATQNLTDHPLADWHRVLSNTVSDLPLWQALADLVLTEKGTVRQRFTSKEGFSQQPESALHKQVLRDSLMNVDCSALHALRQCPMFSEADEKRVAIFAALLKLVIGQFYVVCQERREVDFIEVAQRANRAFHDEDGNPSALMQHIDYQLKHLLVDEFQDTNAQQIALLSHLTAGWQDGDGRTLFLVGDPMQSIYRFRKAEVSLFIATQKQGIGTVSLTPIRLHCNHRASTELVTWINQAVSALFPTHDSIHNGAVSYREFIASTQIPQAAVHVHPIISTDADQLSQSNIEAVIKILRQESSEEIAVLAHKRKYLLPLASELRRRGIPFQAVELTTLAERQITQDLLALTHAVCHLADRVHWLAILRAPWCGLTLADLHQLVGDTTSHTIWELMCDSAICQQLSTDGQNRLQKVRQVLDSTLHKHHHQRLSRRVYQAWLALGGAQCVTGEEDIQIAHNFFTQLDQIVGNDIDAVMQLSKDIQNLYMDSDGGVSSKQGIQLMTIHKAKGLEFDCVILMGMGESTHGDRTNKPLILWDTVEGNLLASSYIPQRYHAGDKAETSVYSYLERMENERMAYETMRLLYVALTRAKRVLHLQGSIKLKQADSDIVPVKSSFLSALWQTLEPDFLRATPLSSPIQPSAAAFSPRLVRMLESTDTPYQSASTGWDKKESEYPAQEIDTLEKFVGRLAHIYLELMVKEGKAHGQRND